MAEITTTRQNIRRAIGRAARLEFFLRYGDTGEILASSDATTTVVNFADAPGIVQDTDFWQGDWLYDITLGEERIILNSSSGGGVDVEYAYSVAASSGDNFEIWSNWPPSEIHDVVNRSIRHAWRFFPDVVSHEQLVIAQDKMRYGVATSDLNNKSTDDDFPAVGDIYQIWLETSRNAVKGVVTSTNSATIFNDSTYEPSTDNLPDTDWLVSIYDGAGVGQLREITSVDTDGIFTVDTDLDVQVDTTSRYCLWNPTNRLDEWYKLTSASFDQLENPDWFELTQLYPAAYGLRLRLLYDAQSSDLAADTDVTRVPQEYITYKALSMLYAEMVPDNRHDRAANAGLTEYWSDVAAQFAQQEGRTLPGRTLWLEKDYTGYTGYSDDINPLDWPNRG